MWGGCNILGSIAFVPFENLDATKGIDHGNEHVSFGWQNIFFNVKFMISIFWEMLGSEEDCVIRKERLRKLTVIHYLDGVVSFKLFTFKPHLIF